MMLRKKKKQESYNAATKRELKALERSGDAIGMARKLDSLIDTVVIFNSERHESGEIVVIDGYNLRVIKDGIFTVEVRISFYDSYYMNYLDEYSNSYETSDLRLLAYTKKRAIEHVWLNDRHNDEEVQIFFSHNNSLTVKRITSGVRKRAI